MMLFFSIEQVLIYNIQNYSRINFPSQLDI